MLRVALNLTPEQAGADSGIGQVVAAQWKHLSAYDIYLTTDPNAADVRAAHVHRPSFWSQAEVVHSHGLYFMDVPHANYQSWHHAVNHRIVDSVRDAVAVTVPSDWVAMPFKRDMRLQPVVIPHGLDLADWKPAENQGYILWNKNRGNSDVCDPTPAWELARLGETVATTFPPVGREKIDRLQVLGSMPFPEMKKVIAGADIYLATTLETFGIGTLEAMACGVPVVGYDWGGTSNIVRNHLDGVLVPPGDINALREGCNYVHQHRKEMSQAARERARAFSWPKVMALYAQLYQDVYAHQSRPSAGRVAVVITNYNYGQYVARAVEAALNQTRPPDQVIVVDDGSTDNSREVLAKFGENSRVRLVFQNNQGVAAARNTGIALADDCEFITCLDADDLIDPRFVETLSRALARDRGLGIAYSGLSMLTDGSSTPTPAAWPPEFSWSVQSSVHVPPSNCIPSGCMFRREMWERAGGYRQEYAPGEDTEFWVRGLSVGFRAEKVSNDYLFIYNAHAGSASRTKKYVQIDDRMPWMRDKQFPMGAPTAVRQTEVRSYLFPAVSIIIPVGPGHQHDLEQAIASVVGQSFRYWELIVVDDTGGGYSPEELAGLRTRYPFIHWAITPGNAGAGAARNRGLAVAKGEYVLFLDADDMLLPHALEAMIKVGVTQPCKYVYGDWISLDAAGKTELHACPEYDQHEWKMQHPITALIPRKQAQEIAFDESLPSWEDWDFFIKMAIHGYCGQRVPQPLMVYRLHTGTRRRSMVDADGETNSTGRVVLEQLKARYTDYYQGDKKMASCSGCGGGANEILELKRKLGLINEDIVQTNAEAIPANARVRMEYTGTEGAPISFKVNGHVYRGCATPFHKYLDAPSEDVAGLEATGKWRAMVLVAQTPAQKIEVDEAATMRMAQAPKLTSSVVNQAPQTESAARAEMQARIMAIKAENEAREQEELARVRAALSKTEKEDASSKMERAARNHHKKKGESVEDAPDEAPES